MQLFDGLFRLHQPEGVSAAHKMRQHDEERDAGANSGRKTRAADSHAAGEDEEIVAENVEYAAGEHTERRASRIAAVPCGPWYWPTIAVSTME